MEHKICIVYHSSPPSSQLEPTFRVFRVRVQVIDKLIPKSNRYVEHEHAMKQKHKYHEHEHAMKQKHKYHMHCMFQSSYTVYLN